MIDWHRVAELREEVGDDDFNEVADLFVSEVDAAIARLRQHANPATLERDLHFLKGASLNLGFSAFADLCRTGEATARAGRAALVDLAALFATYETSRSEFLSRGSGRTVA